jgi:hypothetical protein
VNGRRSMPGVFKPSAVDGDEVMHRSRSTARDRINA